VIATCDELGQTSILVHNAGYGDELPNLKAWFPYPSAVLAHLLGTGGDGDVNNARIQLLMNRTEFLRPLSLNMEYANKKPSGSIAGKHQIWGPGQGPDYVGAWGMGPCIGVVIYAPCGLRAAFHFSDLDAAVRTLAQYRDRWTADAKAIIAGATDGSATTVAQLRGILSFLRQNGITVEGFGFTQNDINGIYGIHGIFVDKSGNWIVVPIGNPFD